MKTRIITIAAMIAGLAFAGAEEKMKAPNGGRIIDGVSPQAEFLVTAERKVEIRFLGAEGKVVAPEAQSVTVTTGDRQHPTKLAFAKDGDKLVSDKAIPEGKEMPIVLQIRKTQDAKAFTEKFNLNLANCPTCNHAEYACICDHE